MKPGGNLFVVMGVSGSGKTTMAHVLARETGGEWLEGDDFHPSANREKMEAGFPLKDEDRWPWLDRLHAELVKAAKGDRPVFLACSALKEKYRERLAMGLDGLRFIYLRGSSTVMALRLSQRSHHFMPASLLASQLADLEEPSYALVLDVSKSSAHLVEDFKKMVETDFRFA